MHQARKDRLSVSLGRCLGLNNDFKPGAWAALFEQLITLHIRTTSNCIERLGMGFGCEAGVVLFQSLLFSSDYSSRILIVSMYSSY